MTGSAATPAVQTTVIEPERQSVAREQGAALPTLPGYEVLGELGRGGMGVVYKARHLGLDRIVALKVLSGGGLANPELKERLHVEGEAAARLQHPNIVQVYEWGQVGEAPYLALEYVEGPTLARRLAGQAQPPRDCAELVQTLARAVQHAHEHGIVHRDLKPGNVLLAEASGGRKPPEGVASERLGASSGGLRPPLAEGVASERLDASSGGLRPPLAGQVPRITDFGLARRLECGDRLTPTGEVLGTPAYMAPEQASGVARNVGPACDIYALGAILYEMLTGRPPFNADNPVEAILQVLQEEPMPPRRLNPSVPRDLETICLKCLAKEPRKRYAAAADLADDLQRWLEDKPILARPAGPLGRLVKWARRRPVRAGVLAGTFLVLLGLTLAGLWYWDAYQRTHVEYYRFTVYRWGVREGVGRLAPHEVRHRYATWKVYRRAGQVLAVETVNGHDVALPLTVADVLVGLGQPAEKGQFCRLEYHRDEQGGLTSEVARDQAGKVVWVLHYTARDMAHYRDDRGLPRARSPSGAVYLRFHYSADGLPERVDHLDERGQPRPDRRGSFGQQRRHDARGLLAEVAWLGADGRPALRKDGFAGQRIHRDDRGNIVGVEWLGPDGERVMSRHGYASLDWALDENDNIVEEEYRDRAGRPALSREGFARQRLGYDDRGNRHEYSYFGLDDRPVPHRRGYHRQRSKHDQRGQVAGMRYFDVAGRPTTHVDGFARVARTRDGSGRIIEESYFGVDDRPTWHRRGFARVTTAYDEEGRPTSHAYWGPDGKPALSAEGFARVDRAHDLAGNLVEETYLGPDGRPTLGRNGFARMRREHDHRGNVTAEAYLDGDGRPTVSRDGFARVTKEHDDQGRQVAEAYFDPSGKPTWNITGVARIAWAYQGLPGWRRQTEVRYHGPTGQPALHRDGHAGWRGIDDARGDRLETTYLDIEGKATLHKNGYSSVRYERDPQGNIAALSYYDVRGRPVASRLGIARLTRRYDERGWLIEEAYFDSAGKPALRREGYARLRYERDAVGNITAVSYADRRGRPTLSREGIARISRRHDERGRLLREAYFDVAGKPAALSNGQAQAVWTHDARGYRTSRTYLDGAGRPVRGRSGYASIRWALDSRGLAVRDDHLDEHGKPTLDAEGRASRVCVRDARGDVVSVVYLGTDGKPRPGSDGHAGMTWRYDARGKVLEETYRDVHGKATTHARLGVASVLSAHDERGNCVRQEYRDAGGQLVRHRVNGYARVEYRRDPHGNEIDAAYFDEKGQPLRTRVVVTAVAPGSAGQRAGVRVDDVVLAWGSEKVVNLPRLRPLLDRREQRKALTLTVERQGKMLKLELPPGWLGLDFSDRALSRF